MTRVKPKVSVVVPCFNQGNYIEDTFQSIARQTFSDWECLIVDDGSTDDTAEVCHQWLRIDDRFQYFKTKNSGLSAARNYGLRICSGEYIQFCDSDDILLPEKLTQSVQALSRLGERSIYICDYYRGKNDNVFDRDPLASYLPPIIDSRLSLLELICDWETRISIPVHCFTFTSDFFKSGIKFDSSLPNHEDWECWVRIFRVVKQVVYETEKLVVYRNSSSSMSKSLEEMQYGFIKAIDNLCIPGSLPVEFLPVLRLKRSEISLRYEYLKTISRLR